jgi:hypothetical protein
MTRYSGILSNECVDIFAVGARDGESVAHGLLVPIGKDTDHETYKLAVTEATQTENLDVPPDNTFLATSEDELVAVCCLGEQAPLGVLTTRRVPRNGDPNSNK